MMQAAKNSVGSLDFAAEL